MMETKPEICTAPNFNRHDIGRFSCVEKFYRIAFSPRSDAPPGSAGPYSNPARLPLLHPPPPYIRARPSLKIFSFFLKTGNTQSVVHFLFGHYPNRTCIDENNIMFPILLSHRYSSVFYDFLLFGSQRCPIPLIHNGTSLLKHTFFIVLTITVS